MSPAKVESPYILTPPDVDDEHAVIYSALAEIPDYQRYRIGEEVEQGFEQLHERHQSGEHGVRVRCEDIPIGNKPDAPTRRLWIIEPSTLSKEECDALPNAFVPGNAHTSEVIWTLTYDFLPNALCNRPELLHTLGHRWLYWDIYPRGMQVNSDDLFKDADIDIDFLVNNLGRAHMMPEWGLSAQYKRLVADSWIPDAQALEYIIDKYKPVYGQALHNTLLNSFMYTSEKDNQPFYEGIVQLRNAIRPPYPPATAGSDLNHAKMLAPGIYFGLDAQTIYDDYTLTTGSEEAAGEIIDGNNVPGYIGQTVANSMRITDESGYLVSQPLAEKGDVSLGAVLQRRLRNEMVGAVASMNTRVTKMIGEILTEVDSQPIGLTLAQRLQHGSGEMFYGYWVQMGSGIFQSELSGKPVPVNQWPNLLANTVLFPAVCLGTVRRLADSLHMDKLSAKAANILASVSRAAKDILEPEAVSRRAQVAMQSGSVMLGVLASKHKQYRIKQHV